jgi:hypothetical protein
VEESKARREEGRVVENYIVVRAVKEVEMGEDYRLGR